MKTFFLFRDLFEILWGIKKSKFWRADVKTTVFIKTEQTLKFMNKFFSQVFQELFGKSASLEKSQTII